MAAMVVWLILQRIGSRGRTIGRYLTSEIVDGNHGIPEPRWLYWTRTTLHVLVRFGYWLGWFIIGGFMIGGSIVLVLFGLGIL